MNIGLIDVDGHNFPNLALMKLSAYHKGRGDDVGWVTIDSYDRTYMSKVFTFTPDYAQGFSDYGELVKGGTGYDISATLSPEIDRMMPDYDLYPNISEAYGFLTRGCPRKCSWCIVPRKEGDIRAYMDIEEFLCGRPRAVLMDNNVLAHEHGLAQIEKIINLGISVDFNQGLDARIIAEHKDVAMLLSRVRWSSYLRMACDTKGDIPFVEKAIQRLNSFGIKSYKIFVYVLVKNVKDGLERVEFLRDKGCNPFAQPYLDFETGKTTKELRRFARWVNHKAIFKSVDFKNYK